MEFDVAIKGWVRVEAENEAEAKEKSGQIVERLTVEGQMLGHTEGAYFEEVGIEPLEPLTRS